MKRLHFMLLVLAASAILVGCGGNTNQITPTVQGKTKKKMRRTNRSRRKKRRHLKRLL